MAGLVPAIHAARLQAGPHGFRRPDGVDGRDKPGHDGAVAVVRTRRFEHLRSEAR